MSSRKKRDVSSLETQNNMEFVTTVGSSPSSAISHTNAEEFSVTEPQGRPQEPAKGVDQSVEGNHSSIPRKAPDRKLYQDEIYGTKELSPLAVALVDTPEFQRLGHIYQLGFTHMVFRGANHRRFDHSVGTYFISRTLLRRIVQNHARLYPSDPVAFAHPGNWLSPRLYNLAPGTPKSQQYPNSPMGRWRGVTELVSAAALLHDLGHVAVGHTLEDEFSVFEKHDSLGGPRLFELLYGPRVLAPPSSSQLGSGCTIDEYFGPIDERRLPHPSKNELRVPLPWVFENALYEPFFSKINNAEVPRLDNWEIRDLVYLILSFKEEITETEYITFDELLESEYSKAEKHSERWARLGFIRKLHARYSRPVDLGPNQPQLPLFHPFMSDIVGNTICADLLDYLVRDGKRLKLDIRDNPRLQRYLVIKPESSFVRPAANSSETSASFGRLRLAVNAVFRNGLPRRDTVSDLLDLMRERYRFAEVVYYHPKKAAFSAMLAKALESSPKESQPRDQGIYPAPWHPCDGETPTSPHVVHLGDETLLAYLARGADTRGRATQRLARGIAYRDEYRLLFTLDYEAADAAGGPLKFINGLRIPKDSGRKAMEDSLAQLVTKAIGDYVPSDDGPPVLIYCPNIRMQAKEVAARVEVLPNRAVPLNRQGEDPTLQQEIRLLNQKYQRLWRLYLFIAPRLMPRNNEDTDWNSLLSAIVDAFCHKYGVQHRYRERGFRHRYIRFEDRLDSHYQNWKAVLPGSAPHNEILGTTRDIDLWSAILQRPEAPFPVNREEYNKGFAFATTCFAATSAELRLREEWPDDIRGFVEMRQWYQPSTIPRVDSQQAGAMKELIGLGSSVLNGGEHRNNPTEWGALIQAVARTLRGTKK